MYFYTDHDMSKGDKKVSTIVSLIAISVCVCPCVSFPITTKQTCHPRWALPVRTQTLHACVCLFEQVQLYSYHISCSYLASFPGLHVLLLQSHLMSIGAETGNTQYLNTNPTCSAVQLFLYALNQAQMTSKVYMNEG